MSVTSSEVKADPGVTTDPDVTVVTPDQDKPMPDGAVQDSPARSPSSHDARLQVEARLQVLSQVVQTALVRLDLRDEDLFNALAWTLYRFQCDAIIPLGNLARLRTSTEAHTDAHFLPPWHTLPPVPLAAYQAYALHVLAPERLSERSRRSFPLLTPPLPTSSARPGRSPSDSASTLGTLHFTSEGLHLHDTALLLQARRYLFPEGETLEGDVPHHLLFLASPPATRPVSGLAHYLERLNQHFAKGQGLYLGDQEGIRMQTLVDALLEAVSNNTPLTLIASRDGLWQVLTWLEDQGIELLLPERSRVLWVERGRPYTKEGDLEVMQVLCARWLGVESTHLVQVMERPTLPGQLYTDALAAHHELRKMRPGWQVPPWVRVCALDPETLEPCPVDRIGVLMFVNLANVERPLTLLSDEPGLVHVGGGLLFPSDASRNESSRALRSQVTGSSVSRAQHPPASTRVSME